MIFKIWIKREIGSILTELHVRILHHWSRLTDLIIKLVHLLILLSIVIELDMAQIVPCVELIQNDLLLIDDSILLLHLQLLQCQLLLLLLYRLKREMIHVPIGLSLSRHVWDERFKT